MMGSVRWAFRFGSWKPTQAEWTLASRCIQQEEKDKIGKFVFKKDGKASMVGRLLIRKVVAETLTFPWKEISLARTEKGKPYLTNENIADPDFFPNFNFNASHAGDYTVLAAEPEWLCGVDVMKVEARGTPTIPEFFRLMKRQLTYHEWEVIQAEDTEWKQLEMFYRFWCLKESYIKAIGIGLGLDLQTIEFHPKTRAVQQGMVTTDTKFYLNGTLDTTWDFHESKLDDLHFVCVALKRPNGVLADVHVPTSIFKEHTFVDLVSSAQPLFPEDVLYWEEFAKKEERPRGQRTDAL
ncbi:L-aminoadipate-semialdehyde dehydrogenase-phosphopantetheinyl transferase-like [Acanthaster planci]|uniref:L-aminoadipate-semialdehyde dehydrogenase-phosphopantetheinyl transferase n=1 Tax=Acanthaster planci TaxID=133434 RepID=A0A8B7Z2D2_ACAPL|nr:L-aminoadipate-semialdehyde dehydrogenase-phosphopantetheinyl transferase-like [Acanthaster planci]XP_022098935.1 L-aminoadipate-semialdehyde dehydrogenase-phosphopantetheinyl transferase-like [Acanthaster planci]